MPAEYVGKDVAVVALDNMLAAYYEGKQIALHRISYQRNYEVPAKAPFRFCGERRKEWSGRSPRRRQGRSRAELLPTRLPILSITDGLH